jgi:hypothetical protein
MTTYGLIFWGNSTSSVRAFKLQRRVVRIMTGAANNDSCKKKYLDCFKYCHYPHYMSCDVYSKQLGIICIKLIGIYWKQEIA